MRHDYYRPPGRNELARRAGRAGAAGRVAPPGAHALHRPAAVRRSRRSGGPPDVGGGRGRRSRTRPRAIRVDQAVPELGVPIGWWRSVYSSQNAFAEECVRRRARAGGREGSAGVPARAPPRAATALRGVLRLAAAKAGWGGKLAGRARPRDRLPRLLRELRGGGGRGVGGGRPGRACTAWSARWTAGSPSTRTAWRPRSRARWSTGSRPRSAARSR